MPQASHQAVRKIRLGELLVTAGVITQSQLEEALFTQKKTGERLGIVLRKLGFVSEETLIEFLGRQLDIPSIDLDLTEVDEDIVRLIPEAIARKYKIIAVAKIDKLLTLATADPLDLFAMDDAESITGCQIIPVITTEKHIQKALDKYYWMQGANRGVETGQRRAGQKAGNAPAQGKAGDGDTKRFIEMVLRQALIDEASDIHIEMGENELRVRIRVDGILHEITTAPKSIHRSVVSRLKILAELDIAEKRAPQDGRFAVYAGDRKIDFRMSTVPTIFGEKVVLRVLEKKASSVSEESLGFDREDLQKFRRLVNSPYGMILVSGPTGSGKTTTLYTALSGLATVEKNVVTIEDPVEYTFDMINQIQVNPKAGVTFATGLRSVLRQDPDIIMVGEIRDSETAEIAVHAAMTGHLVLSTLHTNDAITTLPRLAEMGVPSFLLATTVNIIIAQRLVRKICPNCIQSFNLDREMTEELQRQLNMESILKTLEKEKTILDAKKGLANLLFYRGKGCKRCNNTGYKGRIGIYEALEVDENVRNLILKKSDGSEIGEYAKKKGVISIVEDGFIKAKNGITTIEEILRVTKE